MEAFLATRRIGEQPILFLSSPMKSSLDLVLTGLVMLLRRARSMLPATKRTHMMTIVGHLMHLYPLLDGMIRMSCLQHLKIVVQAH
jgi:hypothetical protein